jgi:hypothetical protein
MSNRATRLHGTVWYRRFKRLSEQLNGNLTADTLRAIHQFLDSSCSYGSRTTAAAAHDSVELLIEELHLNGAKPSLGERLAHIEASAYGKTITAMELLNHAKDEDLVELFSSVYEGLLQEGIFE